MTPNDPHDLAIWLLDNLEGVRHVGENLWEGRVPATEDFSNLVDHISNTSEKLAGISDARTRTIGFHPRSADVYGDLDDLIAVAVNCRRVPSRFKLMSSGYCYPSVEPPPEEVAAYISAVNLWATLRKLADIEQLGSVHFVSSYDAQLEVKASFRADELCAIPSLGIFAAEFAQPPHEDQKRAIVRTALVDHFKPKRVVSLGEMLAAFESVAMDARRSLAMYMTEFSVKKVQSEVERQNLDDALSLNKILSDIQNQLLALPAAMLLAGATITANEPSKNWWVLAGIAVFCVLIWVLVGNQGHSVDAIGKQIERRKAKVKSMPGDSGLALLGLFSPLEMRVLRQRRTLSGIAIVVLLVLLLTAGAVVNANCNGVVMQVISRFAGWVLRISQPVN